MGGGDLARDASADEYDEDYRPKIESPRKRVVAQRRIVRRSPVCDALVAVHLFSEEIHRSVAVNGVGTAAATAVSHRRERRTDCDAAEDQVDTADREVNRGRQRQSERLGYGL